eukprot:TRINITY_DN35458_c0_g1_i1.p2 TRINITY_DN35458_c0_g1~~TRINITY_DN35458_c0_g1_i1.p2  ORF type:complete len:339 (+),score=106.15 TRINITY_DN35458_c0_g1_i1:65-1018(+)
MRSGTRLVRGQPPPRPRALRGRRGCGGAAVVGRVERVSCFPSPCGGGWRRIHHLSGGVQVWDLVEGPEAGTAPAGGAAVGDRVCALRGADGVLLSLERCPAALAPPPPLDGEQPPLSVFIDLLWWWHAVGAEVGEGVIEALAATAAHAAAAEGGAGRHAVARCVAVAPVAPTRPAGSPPAKGLPELLPPQVGDLHGALRSPAAGGKLALLPECEWRAVEAPPRPANALALQSGALVEAWDPTASAAACLATEMVAAAAGGAAALALVAGDGSLAPVCAALGLGGCKVQLAALLAQRPPAAALAQACSRTVPLRFAEL